MSCHARLRDFSVRGVYGAWRAWSCESIGFVLTDRGIHRDEFHSYMHHGCRLAPRRSESVRPLCDVQQPRTHPLDTRLSPSAEMSIV